MIFNNRNILFSPVASSDIGAVCLPNVGVYASAPEKGWITEFSRFVNTGETFCLHVLCSDLTRYQALKPLNVETFNRVLLQFRIAYTSCFHCCELPLDGAKVFTIPHSALTVLFT